MLLVDDILTTGATCGAAARVLKRAGAARVVVVVVGRPRRKAKSVMSASESDSPPRERSGSGRAGANWPAGRPSWVADRLRALHPGLAVELVEIKTQGDRDRNSPLAAIGGLGLFTKEIQRALLDRAVEVAVHSLKDLPTQGPAGPDAWGRSPPRGRRPTR